MSFYASRLSYPHLMYLPTYFSFLDLDSTRRPRTHNSFTNFLTTSSTSSARAPGFNISTVSLPINVVLQPGLVVYPQALYSWQAQFLPLPITLSLGNASVPLSAGMLAMSSKSGLRITAGGSSRVVFRDSVPDVSRLPGITSMSLSAIESNACSPPCSSASVCSRLVNARAHLVQWLILQDLRDWFLWTFMPGHIWNGLPCADEAGHTSQHTNNPSTAHQPTPNTLLCTALTGIQFVNKRDAIDPLPLPTSTTRRHQSPRA